MSEQELLIERLVAFANTNGGSLHIAHSQREGVEHLAAQCQPPLAVQFDKQDGQLMAFVPQSSAIHATPDGRVLGQSRLGVVELNGYNIRQLAAARTLGDFEITPVPGVKESDLDLPFVPNPVRVVDVVLYAYQPQQWLPQAHIVMRRWVGKQVATYQTLTGPLLKLLTQAEACLTDSPFPQVALREALINALIHRDYRLPQPIAIDIHSHYIDIISPGQPPAFVDLASITHHQYRRNPRIAYWLAQQNYSGVGLGCLYTALTHDGYPEPSLNLVRNQLRLRLYQNKTTARPTTPILNNRQERALAYLREHGSITQRVYSTLCPDTAPVVLDSELTALEQLGILTRIGELAYVLEQSWT